MRLNSLLYHDVTAEGESQTSGFPGAIAARYKLTTDAFAAHLEAIETRGLNCERSAATMLAEQQSGPVLTFDDGGGSFLTPIADLLDARGWTGHFFITTERLGTPGFLSEDDVRELASRGHIIGSHSHTHPTNIAELSDAELAAEWNTSAEYLSDLLNDRVTTGSIPGGYYSERVAQAAFASGITLLFTSEPTGHPQQTPDGTLLGRFSVVDSTPARKAASLAAGDRLTIWKLSAVWSAKKGLKRVMGPAYRKLSERFWSSRAGTSAREPERVA